MATTMNPVDLYSDPALDGIIDTSKPARRSSHNRRASGQVFDSNTMPHAPEVPRGPPISYRGAPVDPAVPQRSFSQRAKGRPFAKEAFEVENQSPSPVAEPAPVPRPSRHQAPPIAAAQPPERTQRGTESMPTKTHRPLQDNPPSSSPVKEKLRVDTNIPSQENTRPKRQAAQPGDTMPSARSQPIEQQPRRASAATRSQQPQLQGPSQVPLSAMSRSSARVAADGSRDWAPDRSPLQKLEVTLNDMSKEEKRARVQEAEMNLREQKARRAMQEAGIDRDEPLVGIEMPKGSRAPRTREPETAAAEPNLEDAGLVRNLSKTHRDRLQHSTIIDNHRPDVRMLSGEGKRGFDYSPSQPEPEPVSYPRTNQASAEPRRVSLGRTPGHSRTASTQQSQGQPRGHPRVAADDETISPNVSDRSPGLAEWERNASHKAALAKLTGTAPDAAAVRTGSRKLQKAPPLDIHPTKMRKQETVAEHEPTTQSRVKSDAPSSARDVSQQSVPQALTPPPRIRDPNGVGAGSPAFSSPMSSRLREGVGKRTSKSSVTFKEPISKRPVDEWKEAKTVRLSMVDFKYNEPAGAQVEQAEKGKAWWEEHNSTTRRRRRSSAAAAAAAATNVRQGDAIDDARAEFKPRLFVRCGPLLRYLGLKSIKDEGGKTIGEVWRGSIMIVTQDSHSDYSSPPTLRLFGKPKSLLPPPPEQVVGEELASEYIDPLAGLTKMSRIGRALYVRPVDHLVEEKDLSQLENDEGLFEASPSLLDSNGHAGKTTAASNNRNLDQDGEAVGKYQEVQAARLYADPDRDVTFWRFNIEVELGETGQHIAYRISRGASSGFWVPARGTSMNIMFHSCNGFSLSVNPDQFSGPDPLWRDVLNVHQTRPFHVMIGGGDQIYNDRVTTETRLFSDWLKIRNPQHKHNAPFTKDMQEELESFYLNRYCMWFSQGLFGMASSQIPMVNIWDDHDIIDGFGSYPDHFMKTPVFSGLGNVAFKYYMLFQHQSVPEETAAHEPSWVLGHEHGPYINQLSRSVFMQLGKQIAFLGIDCRTERMRDEILSIRTFDNLLERCRSEIVEGETKHLLVLLGVPIAYPRLVWLENVLTSRAMDPIKALNRMGVMKTGFLNKFDGGVEILDDLDDHWTASHHKSERNDLITDLQDLAAEKSVRITILGGDVHLAAVGQFRSNPKLKIPKDHDHRYMPNVISSAIVNTPPPDIMADIINKRNKTHTMDKYTEEDMIPMFTHDVDRKKRNNVHLLPRRNWCSIKEYVPGSTPPPTPPRSLTPSIDSNEDEVDDLSLDPDCEPPKRRFSFTKEPANLIRRLSTKRAPPSAYPQNEAPPQSASFNGVDTTKKGFFGRSFSLSSRRASSASPDGRPRAASLDRGQPDSSGNLPRARPGILRRPTNFSEKAARKGNVPAIDAEGNEIDVNDTIDLQGGLDVVLNVEVNQKDPAGITTPYRLLVPALWYDGSSDREKLPNTPIMEKKGPLLGRMFSSRKGNRNTNKAPASQGQGNWGQEVSDSESYSGEEPMAAGKQQPPRRRFSLFGNRRQKQEELYSSDEDSDLDGPKAAGAAAAAGAIRQAQTSAGFNQPPAPQNSQQAQQQMPQRHTSAPNASTAPRGQGAYDPNRFIQPNTPGTSQPGQRRMQMPETHDPLYDVTNQPPAYHTSRMPVRSPNSAGVQQTQMQPGGLLPSQQHNQQYAQPVSSAPKRHLTIGGRQRPASTSSPSQPPMQSQLATQALQHNLQQHHSHVPKHHTQHHDRATQAQNRAALRPDPHGRSASDSYPIQSPSTDISSETESDEAGQGRYEATYPQPPQRRHLSKQERILGIGEDDAGLPQQGALRGNGIIGKGYRPPQQDDDGGRQSAGYSGIDAWRDPSKPKRGFSFRGMRDWLDGRGGDRERERDYD
ncbi:uncharacterized protein HMPREF1541_07820 [Cyphellophora europaea CBS 101466]|uniref:PhoD-like phosphatase domain-containing protein n=1 Tax=Cyphellophora europaea (strain CBS 101466) TaxID=1220924 RepID=W2RMA5_CYPE1|nr:uncharacterized protein HMPREF1541_07820 [Cyphellophora europaea CBS 101466]ETN36833.1 hypothetical protein HMPREF1541_07820 [Cyphellophora europaea CBS 101466]